MRAIGLALVLTVLAALPVGARAQEVQVDVFRDPGLGVDWCHATNRIAYDTPASSGFYELHVANPDGSNDVCISQSAPGLPGKNVASPGWSPDGRFVLASVEKASHPGSETDALPGFGAYTDLWLLSADGSKAWPLTNVPNDSSHGTIGGHFSADGAHITWTERTAAPNIFSSALTFGGWVVRVADISITASGPVLSNIRSVQPGGVATMNEAYGFSPDGSRLIFASAYNQSSPWSLQIFTTDVATLSDLRQLTSGNYNEHAVYAPDGSSIIWMTNAGSILGGTDWWMMNPDGSQPRRLTSFNIPGNPQCTGSPRWAGLVTFSPDGSRFMGGCERNLLTIDAQVLSVQILPAGTGSGLRGEYFTRTDLESNGDHSGPTLVRTDAQVAFNWGFGTPDSSIPTSSFSARWTGMVQPYFSETYTFTCVSDDGVRLWVDGQLVIDGWSSHAALPSSGTISLSSGQCYPIRLEYFTGGGLGSVSLSWSSAHQAPVVIPSSQLYPATSTSMLYTLSAGGRSRTYRLHASPELAAGPCPLVFCLHGAGGTSAQAEEDYNLDALSDAEGFVVAYPDGVRLNGGQAWASGFGTTLDLQDQAGVDDVGFISAVIDDAGNHHAIDAQRVYACGLSSGGMMCCRLASQLSSRIAAVADFEGPFTNFSQAIFHPTRPLSALLVQGTGDVITPYTGETLSIGQLLSAQATNALFLAADGLSTPSSRIDYPSQDGTQAHLALYGPTAGGAEVVTITVDAGGHTWPGSIASSYGGWLGATCFDIDGAATAWCFFRRHTLSGLVPGDAASATASHSLAMPAPAGTTVRAATASTPITGVQTGVQSSAGCGVGGGAGMIGLSLVLMLRKRRHP